MQNILPDSIWQYLTSASQQTTRVHFGGVFNDHVMMSLVGKVCILHGMTSRDADSLVVFSSRLLLLKPIKTYLKFYKSGWAKSKIIFIIFFTVSQNFGTKCMANGPFQIKL